MVAAPTGTVTFMFTDIESSTDLWEIDEPGMIRALEQHNRILRGAIDACGGTVFASAGDGLAAAFARAGDAVAGAVEAQRSLGEHDWGDGPVLRVRMGLHTGEAHERSGDYLGPAVNCAARVMEAANATQILATAATVEVLRHALPDDIIATDVGEHLLRGFGRPVRLFRLDAPGLDDRRPPRTSTATVGNLPVTVGSLLGRGSELHDFAQTLRPGRLLTITGTGGIGKTSLAIELAHHVGLSMPDGAWLVRLDALSRDDEVLDLLLATFGIDPAGGRRSLDVLIGALRPRRALVVLDNCEHVRAGAAPMAEAVISSCPHLNVIATSRIPLDVVGEQVMPLTPLDTSDGGPAVSLFLDRAKSAGAHIDVGDEPIVGDICRRLDGIPLALELAAARTRVMSPAVLLQRLDDMPATLKRTRPRIAGRHDTLANAIDWSMRDLSPSARLLLGQLSVFGGSFGLDAAGAIAGIGTDVIDPLEELVDHSLVTSGEERTGDRFRLLEPVRQYASSVTDPTDVELARRRHADFYCTLLTNLDRRWRRGDDQGAWPIARREFPDLRLAFATLCEQRRIDDAERFAAAGWGPILMHFDYAPQAEWAPRALALDPDHVGPHTAAACAVAAWGALSAGDHPEFQSLLRRGAAAVAAGAIDDGLLFGVAHHAISYGVEPQIDRSVLDRWKADALRSDDLFRQVLVLAYARSVEAIPLARELGSVVMRGFAGNAMVHGPPPPDPKAALEDSWEIAQRAHSFVLRNSTGHVYASFEVCLGAPLDGLLMMRPIVRDWLLRGDARAWENLHTMAAGFARLGDRDAVENVLAAIGDRPLGHHVGRLKPLEVHLIESAVGAAVMAELSATGGGELGTAVDFACARAGEHAEADRSLDSAHIVAELTDRQIDVARLVAHGFSNKDIARELDISRYTVETHVRNILERLGATSRTQIATWFLQHS